MIGTTYTLQFWTKLKKDVEITDSIHNIQERLLNKVLNQIRVADEHLPLKLSSVNIDEELEWQITGIESKKSLITTANCISCVSEVSDLLLVMGKKSPRMFEIETKELVISKLHD